MEIYKLDGVYRYNFENDKLVPDVELPFSPYITVIEGDKKENYNWERIPLICFKYNAKEMPLIRRVKSLQDGINIMLSDFENNMQEDSRNTILVIHNYDGEDLGEFRRNLATYGAVKVKSTGDGADGGVDTLTVEVNAENYKAILELFKKALIENARGYDAKDDRMASNPNQMNIQSMYSDIDLDANGMETEFQASLEEMLWFINKHLKNTAAMEDDSEDVEFIFNRDILINETESIDNCKASVGILSDETIIEQHPWVKDVQKELDRIKKQKEDDLKQATEMQYGNAFNNNNAGGLNNEE